MLPDRNAAIDTVIPDAPFPAESVAQETITTEMQVANVLAGKTASGAPHSKPIAFPTCGIKHALLIRWANPFPDAADPVRTAYIRKLAHYIVRLPLPIDSTDIIGGMVWFIEHPQHACSPLSFAGAVRLSDEGFAQRGNAAEKELREAMRREAGKPMPPPPVIFERGTHALHELVHPKQMIMVGIAGKNCLARERGGQFLCNAHYWCLVSRKLLRIFALWDDRRLLCVFSVSDNLLREWQYAAHPSELVPVLPACLAELEKCTGPLNADHVIVGYRGRFEGIHQASSVFIRRAIGDLHAQL